nr:hypothetical protein [Alkalilimnicola ehrlichii]
MEIFGRGLFGDIEQIVNRRHPEQTRFVVNDRQRLQVVMPYHLHAALAVGIGADEDRRPLQQTAYLRRRFRQNQAFQPQRTQKAPIGVFHEHDVRHRQARRLPPNLL